MKHLQGVLGESRVVDLTEELEQDLQSRKTAFLRDINERNLGYFEQEVQKLDAWADDLKLGLEQEIKEIDREIKEVAALPRPVQSAG